MASSFPFDSLCEDLQAKLIACVAATSDAAELHKLHQLSKSIKSICEEPFVLSRASIGIPLFPWYKTTDSHEKYEDFVQRCFEAGNPEAFYRVGLVQYFHERSDEQQQAEGLKLLADASKQGIDEATQIYGLILLCLGGENKQLGYEILRPFVIPLVSGKVSEMEDRWSKHNSNICWIGRPKVVELRQQYVRDNCMCDGLTSKLFARDWAVWERFERSDGMATTRACEVCLWDEVLKRFLYINPSSQP